MVGSFWQARRGAGSKKELDHVGENGARLGNVDSRDGRSIQSSSSRRRKSSVLMAQISLSASRTLR